MAHVATSFRDGNEKSFKNEDEKIQARILLRLRKAKTSFLLNHPNLDANHLKLTDSLGGVAASDLNLSFIPYELPENPNSLGLMTVRTSGQRESNPLLPDKDKHNTIDLITATFKWLSEKRYIEAEYIPVNGRASKLYHITLAGEQYLQNVLMPKLPHYTLIHPPLDKDTTFNLTSLRDAVAKARPNLKVNFAKVYDIACSTLDKNDPKTITFLRLLEKEAGWSKQDK